MEIDEMVEFDGDLWGVEVGENAKMWEREKEKEKEKDGVNGAGGKKKKKSKPIG